MPYALHEEVNGVFYGVIADTCPKGAIVNAFTGPSRVLIPYRFLHSEHAIGDTVRYSCVVKEHIAVADRVF